MKKSKPAQDRLYPIARFTPQSKNLPATQGMLHLVRNEFREGLGELRSEMKSEFKQISARFSQVDARFSQMDAKFEKVLEAVHHVAGQVARVGILVEEQHAKNNIALEGHTGLAQRQDRIESRMDEVEKLVRSVARSRS